MYGFMFDQVLGISGLINLSNIVVLVAFSARDVLKLRILAIVGEGLTLPYYYLQHEKLWPPIVWGAAFMIVNGIRVVAIALERRPVVLSDREERLYRIAFSSIDKKGILEACQHCQVGRLFVRGGRYQNGSTHIRNRSSWRPRSHSQRQC
jgi:hypothetical protein